MHCRLSFYANNSGTSIFFYSRLFLFLFQRDTIHDASQFPARNELPAHIKDEMLSHICLRYKTEDLKQKETLDSLPKWIRSSIAYHIFFPIIEKVYLLCGVSFTYMLQLVWKTTLTCSCRRNWLHLLYAPTAQAPAVADFGEARGAQGQHRGGLLMRVGVGWAVLVARAVLVERAEGLTTFPDWSIPLRLRSFVAKA
jgi:hypothetical protein